MPVKVAKYKKIVLSRAGIAKKRLKIYSKKVYVYSQHHPFRALFFVLALFLLLTILGNVFLAPKPEVTKEEEIVKEVEVHSVGSAAQVTYQGKIEKTGVVKIVAQTPGIVSEINVTEGNHIVRGTRILSLSSNYQGGNALSVARQIAGTTYANAKNTYDDQKEIIAKQRELTNKNSDNAVLMRDIAAQSASSTRDLASLNQDIVDTIEANLEELEATNIGGVNDAAILQTKQALAQFQSALIQTTSSYRNLEIQSNSASNDTANLQRDIALKQLDIQEKALKMNLDIAGLQLRMAQINEANMFPVSPFTGVVDRVFVVKGQSVNPGTVLAQISGDKQFAQLIVNVPEDIAKNISVYEPSVLYFDNGEVAELMPQHVSRDATTGVLYSVIYDLGDPRVSSLTDSAYIEVKIPIGAPDTLEIDPYIPIDSIVQTQDKAVIYVVDRDRAKAVEVVLGQIQGRYVQVLSVLPENAKVILNRDVINGDKVKVIR